MKKSLSLWAWLRYIFGGVEYVPVVLVFIKLWLTSFLVYDQRFSSKGTFSFWRFFVGRSFADAFFSPDFSARGAAREDRLTPDLIQTV